MEISERRQRWKKFNILTPEKLALAHIVLDEIREGSDVMRALRTHPLENGEGYLTKAALVAIRASPRADSGIGKFGAPNR